MIQLEKPFEPGDIDPGKRYTHLRTAAVSIDGRKHRVRIAMDYVYQDGEEWKTAKVDSLQLGIDKEDFYVASQLKAQRAASSFHELFKCCEQFAIDQGLVTGVIMDDPLLEKTKKLRKKPQEGVPDHVPGPPEPGEEAPGAFEKVLAERKAKLEAEEKTS